MRTVRSLFQVTAIRLSLIYVLIFGVFAVGIVIYMTHGTVNLIREQFERSIDMEVQGLARIYRHSGINRLIRTLDRRARAPGANLYVITDPSGRIIAGNVPRIDAGVMARIGWTGRPFGYSRYGEEGPAKHRAIARVLEVPNGMRILVGRDLGEHEGFRNIVRRAFMISVGSMVVLGIATWLLIGKRALKRIDKVSKSSRRIMAGDRNERLPVTGAGDEFDRLSENLNAMLDRINRLDVGIKQMSDNIAHDLKTPITRLRNKADMALANEPGSSEREELIAEIINDCDQIVKTFDALLMISRVESGASVARFEPLDLKLVLADVHELFAPVAEEAEIDLSLAIDDEEDLTIQGNRELISQALSNLIDNALKYAADTSKPGKIELYAGLQQGQPTVCVSDNGPGIVEEDRDIVLKRFTRLDSSRNRSGNGLGLSLVNAIANFHSGELHLSDNQPGLKVTVKFPVRDADEMPKAKTGKADMRNEDPS